MSDNSLYIGFDFSMNKPAMTAFTNGRLYFYFWPSKLTQKNADLYAECGVNIKVRCLDAVNPKKMENSQIVLIHTIRSTDLANMIISDIDNLIASAELESPDIYICSEGLSYDSRGDAGLNLATYKGVLLSKIYEHFGDNLKRLFTYSPITIKATAGCATKEARSLKQPMIQSFCRQAPVTPFKTAVTDGTLVAKTNYIEGVDDLVDSYWTLVTMSKKEKYNIF